MHIHIRTSVPGIQKLPSLSCPFPLLPSLLPFCATVSSLPTQKTRRDEEEGEPVEARGGSSTEGEGIGNRRAIRETQRKDSITSYKESKPSGEINKQPWLLALRRRRGSEEKRGESLCGKRKTDGCFCVRPCTFDGSFVLLLTFSFFSLKDLFFSIK